jgi:hypothetical protein
VGSFQVVPERPRNAAFPSDLLDLLSKDIMP